MRGCKTAVAIAAIFSSVTIGKPATAQEPVDSAIPLPPIRDSLVLRSSRAGIDAPEMASDSLTRRSTLPYCGHSATEVRLRRAGVVTAFVGGNAALYSYFKSAWWSGQRADRFFFRADWDENFRDQDKFGHAFGGYHLARIGAAFLRSACISRNRATAWSAAYAAVFQLQIEIWDGLYDKYGFSYPDLLANTAGSALAVLHEVRPRSRAIRPTISYRRTTALKNNDVIGTELRPSLDYSGQTYWMSADVDALLPTPAKPFWPSFLRVSAGHSITDWIDPRTGASLRARRKILLSIDFDAEKLPGENRLWKTFKRQVGYIHLPSPALQISPDFDLIGWYR